MNSMLDKILYDCEKHKRDKSTLLKYYVKERLDKSLNVRNREIIDSYTKLYSGYNYIKLIRYMERENKK